VEFTLLRQPEELLVTLSKEEDLFNEYGILIQNGEFYTKLLGLKIHGKFEKKIENDHITFTFLSKIARAKVTLSVSRHDEYSTRLKIDVEAWGLLGRFLKRKLNDVMINLVIDIEFKLRKYLSFEKKLSVKMMTNYKGLKELIEKLSFNPSSYYFLIIDKKYIIEIVNGIPLAGEEIEKYCRDMCSIELYELKPLG